jgi:hypothetical protein
VFSFSNRHQQRHPIINPLNKKKGKGYLETAQGNNDNQSLNNLQRRTIHQRGSRPDRATASAFIGCGQPFRMLVGGWLRNRECACHMPTGLVGLAFAVAMSDELLPAVHSDPSALTALSTAAFGSPATRLAGSLAMWVVVREGGLG